MPGGRQCVGVRGQTGRAECAPPVRWLRVLQPLPRPGPAPGPGMGAEPAPPPELQVVVVFVVLSEHFSGYLLELFDGGHEEAALVAAGARPDGPMEKLHHRLPQIVPLLPGQGDGQVGYFLGSGVATPRPVPLWHGSGAGEATVDDYE